MNELESYKVPQNSLKQGSDIQYMNEKRQAGRQKWKLWTEDGEH